MRFFGLLAASASFLAAVVSAQNPLAVSAPAAGSTVAAGSALDITWAADTATEVTLTLRSGDANDLANVATIGTVPNTGTYSWTVPANVVSGTTYSIEIADADGGPNSNYSPFFAITGGTGVAAPSAAKSAGISSVNPSAKPAAATTAAATTNAATTTTAAKTLTIKTSTTPAGAALTATSTKVPSNVAAPTGAAGSLAAVVGLGALIMLA